MKNATENKMELRLTNVGRFAAVNAGLAALLLGLVLNVATGSVDIPLGRS